MARRSALLIPGLLAALVLLAPMAAVADSCPDCGPFQSCCPSQGCPCCLPSASVLTAGVRVDPNLGSTRLTPRPRGGPPPSRRRIAASPPTLKTSSTFRSPLASRFGPPLVLSPRRREA